MKKNILQYLSFLKDPKPRIFQKWKVHLLGLLAIIWLFPLISHAQNWGAEQKAPPLPPHLENYQNNFGSSIAIDGHYAVVGAPGNNARTGVAYVLWYNGSSWVQKAVLRPSDMDEYDRFSSSVSISGDQVVIVGSRGTSFNPSAHAYVFEKPEEGWSDMSETAKLSPSDGATYDDIFDWSVGISGNQVVVG
ncbi:hypothetical protein E1171_13350, partial [Cytophagales bacterium RKSG123]|nr:hypothetical protein [Xanthovirga aplysinae]